MTWDVLFLHAGAPPPSPPPPDWAVAVTCALFGIGCAGLTMVLGVLGNRRAAKRLAAWLAEQRYDVIEQRLAGYPYGPYRLRARWSSKFVIRVRLPSGEEKSAWVCMNNFFLWGGGTPEVQWDP